MYLFLQLTFMKSGGVPLSLSMLTKNNFLPSADLSTRRSAYHVVLKMAKLLLTVVGHAQVSSLEITCNPALNSGDKVQLPSDRVWVDV